MCDWFVQKGHHVTTVTSNPYYPEWTIQPGSRNWYSSETVNGVRVLRCPLYVPKKVSGVTRILHELSFVLSSSFRFFLLLFKPGFDVIICVAPPFHTGIFGRLYRLMKGAKFVYHIQDLQVDAAEELELLRSKPILNFLRRTEKSIMLKSDLLSTISRGMAHRVMLKTGSDKVNLTPNWVDIDFVKPITDSTLRANFGYTSDDMLVLYSGNLGEKQGLEIIIEAANELKNISRVKFLICGNGVYKERMIELAESNGLDSIRFTDLFPYEKLPQLLNTADIHLVLQKRETADLVLPSKLTSIAAVGGYSIVTADPNTSLYDEVIENGIGTVIAPGDPHLLALAIRESLSMDLSLYRSNARKYAEMHLNKDVILQSFLNKLIALNGERKN